MLKLLLIQSVFPSADLSRANDTGLLTHKESLPVRSLVLGDVQRPGSESSYKVGPLRCYGDSKFNIVICPLYICDRHDFSFMPFILCYFHNIRDCHSAAHSYIVMFL